MYFRASLLQKTGAQVAGHLGRHGKAAISPGKLFAYNSLGDVGFAKPSQFLADGYADIAEFTHFLDQFAGIFSFPVPLAVPWRKFFLGKPPDFFLNRFLLFAEIKIHERRLYTRLTVNVFSNVSMNISEL